MGHFYFVRHGQTVWNSENKICGNTDSELTEKGHSQAIEAGRLMLREKIKADEILHSPLIRAAETARHISEITGIPRRCDERLREQNFGKWEGTSPMDSKGFIEAKAQFVSSFEGGESMLHLAQRVYNVIDEIKKEPDKVYILVAHNGIARVVYSYFHDMTNEEYAEFTIKNCQVMRFDF